MKLFSFILFFFINFAFAVENQIIDSGIFKARSTDHVYGKDIAEIEVLELFSLTCPHCSYFYENTFPKIKEAFIDKGYVRWIKRSFASDYSATKGTLFLNCIDKERYEVFLKILFNKQSSWAYQKNPLDVLKNIANLGGISTDKFDSCVKNKTEENKLHQQSDEARNILKVSGTPVFYINQKRVKEYSYESFKDEFNKLINKTK